MIPNYKISLLETNIRQRGDVGGSAKKVGKRIKELERLYGIQNGSTHFQGNQYSKVVTNYSEAPKSQEQLATQMGISVDTLQNNKMLADMIPELEDWADMCYNNHSCYYHYEKNSYAKYNCLFVKMNIYFSYKMEGEKIYDFTRIRRKIIKTER